MLTWSGSRLEVDGLPMFGTVRDLLRRLIQTLPHNAYITGVRWDVLAWNEPAATMAAGNAPH